jgi:transcriptional regulator with XRE-family HTH domain
VLPLVGRTRGLPDPPPKSPVGRSYAGSMSAQSPPGSTTAELQGKTELRDFLRSRRARLTPEAAGLAPHPGGRRVPGLRREEVAQLAGVSVDYYVRLERGRNPHVSDTVLDAVARALRLDDAERGHLFALARPSRAQQRATPPQRVRPGLYQVLDSLGDIPALITGRRLDILAGNSMAHALHTDFDALPHRERNMARYIFLDPAARTLYDDWPAAARSLVAILHVDAGRHPHDPQLAELIADLSRRDDDFRRWWTDQNVLNNTHGTRLYHHPVVGDLTLDYEIFSPAGDEDQVVTLHTAEPGSPSERGLHQLARRVTEASS